MIAVLTPLNFRANHGPVPGNPDATQGGSGERRSRSRGQGTGCSSARRAGSGRAGRSGDCRSIAHDLAATVVDKAPQRAGPRPACREGWLSPIELDERTQPLTTVIASRSVGAAAQPAGSARATGQRPGLLPMTLESYVRLLDWTARQLKAGARRRTPPRRWSRFWSGSRSPPTPGWRR